MKMNKEKFLKTEFGAEMDQTVKALDQALTEKPADRNAINELFARLDVYKQGVRTFYGINLYFTRTSKYFGMCTEDESYYLIKVERKN